MELTYNDVFKQFTKEGLTGDEVAAKTNEWMNEHSKGWTAPEVSETDIEDAINFLDLDDEFMSDEDLADSLCLENDYEPEVAQQIIVQAKRTQKDRKDPYYSRLSEADRHAVERLRAFHPDANWNYKKYYEIMRGTK